MDSLPATPLNAVAPATGHSARGSAGSKDADASAFGEVLDSELAAIAPHRKTADITQLASDDVPADAEKAKAAAADDTQVLQAILDATALVPPAGAAVTAVAPQTVQAGKNAGTAPAHIVGAATAQIAGTAATSITGARDVRASSTIPADAVANEPAAVQSKDETAQKPATPAELATAAAQQDATPAKLAAAAAVTPPVVAAGLQPIASCRPMARREEGRFDSQCGRSGTGKHNRASARKPRGRSGDARHVVGPS